MRCSEAVKLLDGFRTRELVKSQHKQVAAHLAACENCAGELAAIARFAAELSGLGAKAPGAILQLVREKTFDRYSDLETELGRIWVGFSVLGVTLVVPRASEPAEFESVYMNRYRRRPLKGELPRGYEAAIRKAAAGFAAARVPLDLSAVSDFEQNVLLLLRKIPRGEVRPYSWLAREAGSPQAVRAVGNAMARNPVPLLLPCHRVVPTGGGIGNYAFGPDLKRRLLAREGVPVEQIEQFARERVRYIGCKTTGIYCLPTCRDARRVRSENRVLLAGAAEAAESGFRPCRHCRP
jgi:O-6-methylguanine DNA methyltransferase